MTNWTDLIDTDPVGAWRLYKGESCASNDTEVRQQWHENRERLMSNLAALCEALHLKLKEESGRPDTDWIKVMMRDNVGFRRFPEVK